MRYLITGGAGFIGSHLSEDLLASGHRVHVLDDLSTGAIDNIRHLKDDSRFSYTIESAASRATIAELVDEADIVFHLAAAVGVELIVDSPVRTIETNVHCTEIVLEAANKKKKPVFITSTSEVYGKGNDLPFREDGDLLLGPTTTGRWSYACSKALDEYLALAYWKERGLPVVIGRLFNTVGPRQTGRYGMVVPSFVRQALAGSPITVHGDGQQRRCFCHVKDVVRAMADLMDSEKAVGEVVNIGSTDEITILDLARAGAPGVRIRVRDSFDSLRRGIRDWFRGHATPYPRHQQDRRFARLARDTHAGPNTAGRDRVSEGAGGAPSERVIGLRSSGKSQDGRPTGPGKRQGAPSVRCPAAPSTPLRPHPRRRLRRAQAGQSPQPGDRRQYLDGERCFRSTSSGRRGYPAGGDRGWTSTGTTVRHPDAGPSRVTGAVRLRGLIQP